MSILVDPAVWPWRGDRWAHLISDVSESELHGFAERLGIKRLGFQGDHYDIPAALRLRALELGAQAVTSRELVSRLRASGLRRRDKVEPWNALVRGEPWASVAVTVAVEGILEGGANELSSLVAAAGVNGGLVSVFARSDALAVLVERAAPGSRARPTSILRPPFVHCHVALADQGWSVEWFASLPGRATGAGPCGPAPVWNAPVRT